VTGVAETVAGQLASAGVRRAYTVPGESFLPLLDAFESHPEIELVSTRHESGASFMAEAEAKLSGVPAVALATRAVGAANMAIGVHTAYQDSTPMVVILGQADSGYLGREAFQEVDLPAFYREITKWAVTATSRERLPELVHQALRHATSGRPGPVLVAVPADLLDGEADAGRWEAPAPVQTGVSPATANAIARLLAEARAPVVIAGGGAQGARTELIEVAERFGAGVYASFRRQDVFPNDHSHYCGHLTLGAPTETLEALEAADVVLVVGARLSEITTQSYRLPRPDQRIAQIDIDPKSVGAVFAVEVGAVADARAALEAVLACAPDNPPVREWTSAHEAFLRASRPPVAGPGALHPATVMAVLSEVFPSSTVVANDAGNFSVFAHRYWRFTEPRTQVGPTSGAMGYGIPAAIGAKLSDRGREVLALAGDGGFLMTGQELETAVRYELPLTAVIFRNGLYGTIALHQARRNGRPVAVDIGDVDIASVARGYGAEAWTVTSADELRAAVTEARRCGRPALVDVVVDADVLTPAFRLGALIEQHRGR
jgi:acetolactate synthase-1/2/3 large subunit